MHRRTLDIIFSVGAVLLAGLLLVMGVILQNQADFAHNHVHDQLAAQKITFTPVAGLKANEKAPCIVDNAGKALTSGKQAECYADHYIDVHLSEVNNGKTYAQTSNELRALPDQTSAQAQALSAKVDTLFRGETLRGLLLTSYGFSIFGDRAQQAALVCFAVALVLFLASIAGFVHAFTTSREKTVEL